jgi:hypothetical protein
MNEKIKNYLGVSIIVAVSIFAISLAVFSYYSYTSFKETFTRSFSVVGEGKVKTIPDIAEISFSVITEGGKDLKNLVNENTEKINKGVAFVKNNKVDGKDIKTESYNLTPRHQYFNCPVSTQSLKPCPPSEIVGYTITQTVSVKIRDFSKIGDILSGIVDNGANTVSELSFVVDDLIKLKTQARSEAIAKAKEQAKEIAKAAGFELGRLLSIDDGFGPIPYYPSIEPMSYAGGMKEMATVAPTIEPGSQEASVSVSLRYEMR